MPNMPNMLNMHTLLIKNFDFLGASLCTFSPAPSVKISSERRSPHLSIARRTEFSRVTSPPNWNGNPHGADAQPDARRVGGGRARTSPPPTERSEAPVAEAGVVVTGSRFKSMFAFAVGNGDVGRLKIKVFNQEGCSKPNIFNMPNLLYIFKLPNMPNIPNIPPLLCLHWAVYMPKSNSVPPCHLGILGIYTAET